MNGGIYNVIRAGTTVARGRLSWHRFKLLLRCFFFLSMFHLSSLLSNS